MVSLIRLLDPSRFDFFVDASFFGLKLLSLIKIEYSAVVFLPNGVLSPVLEGYLAFCEMSDSVYFDLARGVHY